MKLTLNRDTAHLLILSKAQTGEGINNIICTALQEYYDKYVVNKKEGTNKGVVPLQHNSEKVQYDRSATKQPT